MKSSIRGRLVLFSLTMVGVLGLGLALWVDSRAREVVAVTAAGGDPRAAMDDLRAVIVAAGVTAFLFTGALVGIVSTVISRHVRRLVADARRRVPNVGGARIGPGEDRDELEGLAGSFTVIADDLENALSTLAVERNRFEAVLETMDQGVLAIDRERRIVLVNRAARALLELPADVQGRRLLDFVRTPAVHELLAAAEEGRSATAELETGVSSLRRLRVQATGQASGGTVVVLQDVTEIRRLETVRRDFVANVSHELRTPIAVIRANAETLASGALERPDKARVFVDALQRHAERLGHLVSDLLDISRIEAGRWALAPEVTALCPAAEHVAEGLTAAAGERGIALTVAISEEMYAVADAVALDQVLVNLVDNAIKYTQNGGHVEIGAVVLPNGLVRVEVRDDGPGIDPKHRERIFERFYRVDPGRSRDMGGTGLGLAIVRNLVEAMGGEVGVDPRRPRGSVFWFTLAKATERDEVP